MKTGDVVQLKSGGPRMTVERAGRKVVCVWFRSDGEPRTLSFPAATLKATDTAPSSTTGTAPASRSCACKHRLSRHTAEMQCLERDPSGRPCMGKCRIIEGSES